MVALGLETSRWSGRSGPSAVERDIARGRQTVPGSRRVASDSFTGVAADNCRSRLAVALQQDCKPVTSFGVHVLSLLYRDTAGPRA